MLENADDGWTTGANYEIGRGKPPKSGQFKPGHSGNPRGRQSKEVRVPSRRQLRKDIINEMEAPVTTTEKGKRRQVPFIIALMRRMKAGALKNDFRARNSLLKLYVETIAEHDDENSAIIKLIGDIEKKVAGTPAAKDPNMQRQLNKMRQEIRAG